MTIDQATGTLTLPEIDAVIASSLTRSQFLATAAFSAATVSVRNEPWCSYRLPPIPQVETELFIVLQFQGDQLASVSLTHGAARFGSSWADWTEERELALKAFHEHWVTHELQLRFGSYSWGDISSDYDAKGGASSITVRYANPS